MNKMYTSYFGSNKIKTGTIPSGYELVSISKGTPPYYKGGTLDCAKPSWNLVHSFKNGDINEAEYRDIYFRQLSMDKDALIQHINDINNGGKFIYLCYCGKTGFCHRHLWAEFLNKLGIACEEL